MERSQSTVIWFMSSAEMAASAPRRLNSISNTLIYNTYINTVNDEPFSVLHAELPGNVGYNNLFYGAHAAAI
jgi:hypothetical protein